jgi:HlyD family secretion protein
MKVKFDVSPVSAQQSNGLAVRYAAAKREVPRWRWYLMLVIVGMPLLYFGLRLLVGIWWETAPGSVVVQVVSIKATAAGAVRKIASVGSIVQPGDTLLELEHAPLSAPIVRLPTRRAEDGAGLASRHDPTMAILMDAQKLAEKVRRARQERLEVIEALRRESAATQAESDAAYAALVQAESEVVRARADLQARRQSAADQNRGLAEEAGQRSAAATLPPLSSPLLARVAQVQVAVGEYIDVGAEVLQLHNLLAPTIEAYVSPADARYAQVGRLATLLFMDGTRIRASVAAVGAQAGRLPPERVSPLSPNTRAIVVRLQPAHDLPAAYRINALPLDVRFDTVWPWQE